MMPVVRLKETRRIEIETARVKGILEVALLPGPVAQDALLELIKSRGITLPGADLVAIRNALIADGTIEIV